VGSVVVQALVAHHRAEREQHVGVANPRARHRSIGERPAVGGRGEVVRRVDVCMRDADPLPVHGIAAEIRGAQGDRVSRPGATPRVGGPAPAKSLNGGTLN